MIQPKRVEFVEDSWKNQLTINGIESPEWQRNKLSNTKYAYVS